MNRLYTFFVGACVAAASCFSSHAQVRERMVVYPKGGSPVGYWVDHTDSVMFLTDMPDLNASLKITEPATPTVGGMHLEFDFGLDVKKVRVAFPEQFQFRGGIDGMTQDQLMDAFSRMESHWVTPNGPKMEFNLTGLQQGYSYYAIFYGQDEYGCPGEVKYVPFEVPKAALVGNPKVKVEFTNIGSTSLKIKFTPNDDVLGYFYLVMPVDDPNREMLMQMMGIPDLKHYVTIFGVDFDTKKPHVGEEEKEIKDLASGTEHGVYLVVVDKNGQYSEVSDSDRATTKVLGTDKKANITLTLKEKTANSAKFVCKPDENTTVYRVAVLEKAKYNREVIENAFKETPDEDMNLPLFAEEKTLNANGLTPNTDHIVVAMPRNLKKEWGDLVTLEFKTDEGAAPGSALKLEVVGGGKTFAAPTATPLEITSTKVSLELTK